LVGNGDVPDEVENKIVAAKDKILAAHDENSLATNKTITSAKELMQKVMYQVPLSSLYEIMSSCQFD